MLTKAANCTQKKKKQPAGMLFPHFSKGQISVSGRSNASDSASVLEAQMLVTTLPHIPCHRRRKTISLISWSKCISPTENSLRSVMSNTYCMFPRNEIEIRRPAGETAQQSSGKFINENKKETSREVSLILGGGVNLGLSRALRYLGRYI